VPIYPNIYQTLLPGPIVELRGYLAACGLRGRLYAYLNYNGPTGTARDELAEGMLALALGPRGGCRCGGRLLFRVRLFPAGSPQQIVDTDVVEVRQGVKHLRWDVPLAGLVIGIAGLRAVKQPRDILLLEVVIFPQIPNAFIHSLHLP